MEEHHKGHLCEFSLISLVTNLVRGIKGVNCYRLLKSLTDNLVLVRTGQTVDRTLIKIQNIDILEHVYSQRSKYKCIVNNKILRIKSTKSSTTEEAHFKVLLFKCLFLNI